MNDSTNSSIGSFFLVYFQFSRFREIGWSFNKRNRGSAQRNHIFVWNYIQSGKKKKREICSYSLCTYLFRTYRVLERFDYETDFLENRYYSLVSKLFLCTLSHAFPSPYHIVSFKPCARSEKEMRLLLFPVLVVAYFASFVFFNTIMYWNSN